MPGTAVLCTLPAHVCARVQRPPYLAKMEHLACYLPGNLALGVAEGAVGGAKGTRYLAAARGLTATCWHMYLQQPTGALCSACTCMFL